MTLALDAPKIVSRGQVIDTSPEVFGFMRESNDLRHDTEALRGRMQADGYLLFRGLLNRGDVFAARREMMNRLAAAGHLEPGTDPMDGVATADAPVGFSPDLAKNNAPLAKVLYDGPMMQFFTDFLGGPVRHFDFTWIRSIARGLGTAGHCDVVYMGRGTHQLYTAWTPLGDVDFNLGGLMLLEGSNNNQKLVNGIKDMDVDAYCTNRPESSASAKDGWARGQGGWFHAPPPKLRQSLGGRWMTTEYQAGDLLIFTMFTVHCSLDNHAGRIRLSSDSRYQLASEPADERWIGENPIAHGAAGKRGKVC